MHLFCSSQPSKCESVCGDGFITIQEACDDNNTLSNDGCRYVIAKSYA